MPVIDLRRSLRQVLAGSGTLGRYAGSAITLQVVNAACGLAVLRWLDPAAIGLWQALLLIGTYAQFVQGGALHGLNRELPFFMGKEDPTAVLEFAGTGRVVAMMGASLCLLAIPACWLALSSSAERWGTTAVLAGTAAHLYRLFLGATYRAARSFEALARIQLIEAGASVATLALVYRWGFGGLAARYVIQMIGGACLNHAFRPLKTVGSFRWARLRSLFRIGVPIFAFGYLSDVARSFPRLVLLSMGGVAWVGLFAPASAVIAALSMIPAAIGTYIYPQMTHRLGRTGDPSSLWPIAKATALWPLAISLPAALCLLPIVPSLVRYLAPAYEASIPATQWVVGAGVFMGASVAANALASLKAYRWMAVFVVVRLALLSALPWAGGKWMGGITGVAMGMTVAYSLDFVTVLALTRAATRPLARQ